MHPILQMLLKVLDHTQRQRRVNLARTIIAANARQIHHFAAFGGAGAGGRRLGRAENGVGAGRDEVGFHEVFEGGVRVAGAEGRHACVQPGGWGGLEGEGFVSEITNTGGLAWC